MRVVLLALALFGLALAENPTFPDQYYVKGVFSIPYFNITEPIEMWFDNVNNRQVISYYNGMDVTYTIGNDTWNIYPRIDELQCLYLDPSENPPGPLIDLFPDLSAYTLQNETARVNNLNVQNYQVSFQNFSATATYNFYQSASGVPVQLYLKGVDFIFDSHPDIYVMDYGLYIPDYVDDDIFTPPSICQNASVSKSNRNRGYASKLFAAMQQISLLSQPTVDEKEDQFRKFMIKYGKTYASQEEYYMRFATFKETLQFIEKHNKDTTKTHKVGINHFADMPREEFRRKIMPKVTRPAHNGADEVHTHNPRIKLPPTVDWRQKNAVTPVKDQGACGSCYTFGSTGSLEGAYSIKYGELISLSEQQLVDCAWNDDMQIFGCDGGLASGVYQWIIDNGGIATEESYRYLMQDGWCNADDVSSGVQVSAYVNVTPGESNLQSAVAMLPVAVAIDASHEEFRYYTSGVYYQADCSNDIDDLDHEVLAVGYGTVDGTDYWLVKNSWSTYWGDQGYVYMARNRDNNCGIATQPNYPQVA